MKTNNTITVKIDSVPHIFPMETETDMRNFVKWLEFFKEQDKSIIFN